MGPSTSEIDEVKRTPWFQDTPDLAERRHLLLRRQVVEHEGRENEIEGGVGMGQLVRESSLELNRNAGPLYLAPRSGERLWIGIESDDADVGMKLLDEQQERPRAAADVENVAARRNRSLIEERSARLIAAEQLHEWVVERQEPVVAGRGEECPSGRHGSSPGSPPK